MLKKLIGTTAAMALFIGQADAAVPLMTGPWDPGNALGTINSWIMNQLNPSVAVNAGIQQPKNFLDNGDGNVMQRLGASSAQTCGNTSGPTVTAYAADRWACDMNVTSGTTGRMLAQATSNPTPPPGFGFESKIYRNSGVLTQPICAEQEIQSLNVVNMQGQTVILSAYLADLGALAGATVKMSIITGTTADQGLGTGPNGAAAGMTASPAITPVWTGLATASTTTVSPLTTSMALYYSTPTVIPIAAQEAAVLICFTPGSETAGTTDGFAFTGVQLAAVQPGITVPPAYEHKDPAVELRNAQRYYYSIYDAAAGTVLGPVGTLLTTTTCQLSVPFPTTFWQAPTYAALGTLGTGTFKIYVAADTSTLGTTFASGNTGTANNGSFTATLTTASTAGWACTLVGQTASTTVAFTWSSDF